MAKLLQAPTEGYEDAIVILEIAANNFELKHGLINLVQNKQFFGHDKEDSHAHIRYFNKITSMMRVSNVPSSSIKLMLFPFSLEGVARIWLEKEPPRSILTWDDLVTKFINQFFPSSKTTNLRNEITRFQRIFDESFYEAWDRFNDLLRACPHHGFSELHQLDTFYNALNVNDQDSLNSAAGGNFLDKMPRECLKIFESMSKVCQSRAKAVVAKVSTSSSTPAISSDVAELKDMVRALLLDKKNQSSAPAPSPTPAPVKAVELNCVTCGVQSPGSGIFILLAVGTPSTGSRNLYCQWELSPGKEFAGELTLFKSIPPGIDETDCDFEEDIRFIEKLLYDNSSLRPSEEFISANSDAKIKSFSPSPILVKDSDSIMEEIDLLCTPDYPMPPGIMEKDYDSERDILIPKDLPRNNTLSFAEKESFHFDIPPFSRPPAKPPDGDTGILNIKMMGDISDQKAFMHKLMITLASHQEKSLDLLSHRHLNKCPMLIHG
nr:reverse transcriptase domain-containing protein [Tanacetum cinerariifolium]